MNPVADNLDIRRPGISAAMLNRAGIRQVNAKEAEGLCALATPGLFIPYHDPSGAVVCENGKPYGRLRLHQPKGPKKYHQEFGTSVHAYLPPGLQEFQPGAGLYVIEGEFKALALAEAGFAAIGISGFFGFAKKGGEELVSELSAVIEKLKPGRIYFCGDSDTALNYQFSVAAVRVAKLFAPARVLLPRIPLNGAGKGVDDCRDALGDRFISWWLERVRMAIEVNVDCDAAVLAIELFESERGNLCQLNGQLRLAAETRAVKLAAALEHQPMMQERLLCCLEKELKLPRRGLNKAVKAALKCVREAADPERIQACYDPTRKCYWIPNNRQEMIEITETSLQRHLCSAGFSADPESGGLSALGEEIIRIQCEQDVLYAGPLAGHSVGLKEMCGQRILVTRAPKLLEPKQGDCSTIEKLIIGLLQDPEHDQVSSLLGWLKVGYEALAQGQLRHGQALAIAGPRDCGKSLLQNLITEVFGGRSAKPYRYMCGATEFNGDLFGAEHLMIEDEVAFTDIRARRHFGARIKDFTVNTVQSCHGKNRQALSLKPFWRVSITLNDEPENLLILPPIDESLEDKIILLKAKKAPMPMDTSTLKGQQAFMAKLLLEIPAFLYVLQNFQIPTGMKSERFGISHFQHPALLSALSEMSPEMRLLALIDVALEEREDVGEWVGTATDLERMLFESKSGFEARRLLDWNNATGTYLGRLSKKLPHRIKAQRTNSSRQWSISPPHWFFPDYEKSAQLAPVE